MITKAQIDNNIRGSEVMFWPTAVAKGIIINFAMY